MAALFLAGFIIPAEVLWLDLFSDEFDNRPLATVLIQEYPNIIQIFISIFFIFVILNSIPDFISLIFSRYALRNAIVFNRALVWLVVDIFVSVIIAVISIIIYIAIINYAFSYIEYSLYDRTSPFERGAVFASVILLFEGGILYVGAILSTFAMSIWIWGIGSGSLFIRAMSKFSPTLKIIKYILPIEKKPIRSLGICASVIIILPLMVLKAAQFDSDQEIVLGEHHECGKSQVKEITEGELLRIEEKIFQIISEHLYVDKNSIELDSHISVDLHADKFDEIELIMAFNEEFEILISDADAEDMNTPRDVINFIKRAC